MDSIIKAQTSLAALIALGAGLGKPIENPHAGGKAFVLLPKANGDWEVQYLDRPDAPARKRGTLQVADTASFIGATNRYFVRERSIVYASLDPAQFVAVLNEHAGKELQQGGHDGANWRDHRVSYVLRHSKEWDTWMGGQKKDMTQEAFAYFIEDNLPDFRNPAGAKMLEIATNFRVKQGVSFKSNFRPQDGQVNLEYTEQNEAGGGKSGNMTIPETFTVAIPVWKGIDAQAYEQEVRLRYRVAGGNLAIRYEVVRPHKTIEKAFTDVLTKIKVGVKDAGVIFGSPDA
jgi:uncharacterized protein YfdQ (DUF2303 family)